MLPKPHGVGVDVRKMDVQHDYVPLLLPIDKPFEKLNKDEAKQYFDWFILHVDERSEYVRKNVTEFFHLSLDTIDFSMKSIILIWRWFLQAAEIQPTPKSRLNQLRNELKTRHEPIEFISDIIKKNNKELSLISLYIIRDIGMYTGKVLLQNYPVLRWGYHTDTKKDSFANIPQIFGFVNYSYNPPFEMQFDPIHYAEMAAANLLDGSASENDLYDYCMRWEKWIPNNL